MGRQEGRVEEHQRVRLRADGLILAGLVERVEHRGGQGQVPA